MYGLAPPPKVAATSRFATVVTAPRATQSADAPPVPTAVAPASVSQTWLNSKLPGAIVSLKTKSWSGASPSLRIRMRQTTSSPSWP
jgi:hypothetical protein